MNTPTTQPEFQPHHRLVSPNSINRHIPAFSFRNWAGLYELRSSCAGRLPVRRLTIQLLIVSLHSTAQLTQPHASFPLHASTMETTLPSQPAPTKKVSRYCNQAHYRATLGLRPPESDNPSPDSRAGVFSPEILVRDASVCILRDFVK
ncbi:unnamed protein product [Protopolystoma xenopodis]|uniref:Uncharacterized protein n=1 Tax=Protopolystoma xenopodis TaxID=117903 RepID=A0A448XBC4_9PLAT|nr:unnamed protein product [Protopolystoma xenopodis]